MKKVRFPAVALLLNNTRVPSSFAKFCAIPELFVMPTPLMVKPKSRLVNVNALAPGSKTMPLTSGAARNPVETAVILETPKVAVSFGPLGTVAGVQLEAVNQSPLVGLRFHVALLAKAVLAAESKSINMAAGRTQAGALRRRPEGIISLISL